MTATAPAAALRIPLAAIAPSSTNPRKRFDKVALEELAESIKRHDVLQPVLVRPAGPERYELVAGERRLRAAKAAGLVDIPATVRELADAEVLEIQVIENLQRSDLHELEEAEGYEQLLKCAHPDGRKYTVDEIAAKVGKSRSYVFARLKLCSLCPEARKAFYDEKLDASRALLIARIGHHDTQRQALKDVTAGRFGEDEPMSYRQAHQHILTTYMLKLSTAPFDIKDEQLLPKAGACGPCPKRTGNQADLFGDVKSADVCTDPKCFDDKRHAHYQVAVRALEADGRKVIAGAAAKKAFPDWDSTSTWNRERLAGGYLKLEDNTYASGRNLQVGKLLGPEYEPILIQHPLTGEIVKAATQQAVAAAAQKASRQRKSSGSSASAPRERQRSAEEVFRERLFVEICKKLPDSLGKPELTAIAESLLLNGGGAFVLRALFPDVKAQRFQESRALEKEIPKLDARRLSKLVLALALAQEADATYSKPQLLLSTAKRLRVDPDKVKKEIAVEEKAKKAVAAEKKAKPAKKAAAKKPAARGVADFMRPKKPSTTLAAIVGDKAMPRTEVTSKLWGYIKKNALQDKTNRRMINADAKLLPLFKGKKQVSMFEMTKYVQSHLS